MVQLRYSTKQEPGPRSWSVRAELLLGAALSRVGWKDALSVSVRERRKPAPAWQLKTERFFGSTFAFAGALFVACALITAGWGSATRQDINQLWSELGGMTLDVFVILIVYEAFSQRRARFEAIQRQCEIIDDYKRWDAEEARLRIAGALRRLGRSGVTKADFSGLRMSDFGFAEHGVPSLAGSTFYDGDWGNPLNDSAVRLTRVSFAHVDCSGVEFSPFDPFEALDTLSTPNRRYATLVDCSFVNCSLVGAVFNGAELSWTEPPPESHFDVEEDEDGSRYAVRVSEGHFSGADLTGAQFRGCRLQHADFRDAHNLRCADFFRARGLETTMFDSEDDRAWALTSAARPSEDGRL